MKKLTLEMTDLVITLEGTEIAIDSVLEVLLEAIMIKLVYAKLKEEIDEE